MTFLPTHKATWFKIVGTSFLFTGMFSAFLLFTTIYGALGVAEPVTITIESDSIPAIDTEVHRISRGGAQFEMEKMNSNTWYTNEWVRDLSIRYSTTDKVTAVVKVGDYSYTIPLTQNTVVNEKADSLISFSITRDMLGRKAARVPFFEQILNWPGDIKAFLKALSSIFLLSVLCFSFILIIILSYRYWVRKNIYTIFSTSETALKKQYYVLILVCVFILSAVSLIQFIISGPTAYEWPALDMAPFFERMENQNFLPNDFFTNSSSENNPRFVFGYLVIGIGKILNTTWYETFFFLKTLLVVFLPPLIFITLAGFFKYLPNLQKRITITFGLFLFVLAALFPLFIDQFTIALWRPYSTLITPHTFSFCLGLIAIYFANKEKLKVSTIFWILSTLLLPTVSISLLIFYFIVTHHKISKAQLFLFTFIGILLPSVLLMVTFAPAHPLSSIDFVYHYVTSNHSIHYIPSAFETSPLSPLPWYIHLATIQFLLLLPLIYGIRKKDKFLIYTSSLAMATYVLAVLLCYLFIEIHPIKIIATIGPSRYTLLGYWYMAVLYSYLLTYVPYQYLPIQNLLKLGSFFSFSFLKKSICVLLLIFSLGLYVSYKDNPTQEWLTEEKELSSWLTTTETDSVFSTNIFGLAVNLPIAGNRAVFTGNGFPFNEDSFIDFNERRALLYGKPEDWSKMEGGSDRIKSNNFYRTLLPSDFVAISHQYQLNYVIIEAQFASNFKAYTPVFTDSKINVYSVMDLK